MGVIYSATVVVSNSSFIGNSVDHPLVAVGGALGFVYRKVVAAIYSTHFAGNSAQGSVSGGGAIGVVQNSAVTIESSRFEENEVTASGRCGRYFGAGFHCPLSVGGAIALSGGATYLRNCLLENNVAKCSNKFGTGCYSQGGSLSVTNLGSCAVERSAFDRNRIDCLPRSGWQVALPALSLTFFVSSIVASGGAVFGDSGHLALTRSAMMVTTLSFLLSRKLFLSSKMKSGALEEAAHWLEPAAL